MVLFGPRASSFPPPHLPSPSSLHSSCSRASSQSLRGFSRPHVLKLMQSENKLFILEFVSASARAARLPQLQQQLKTSQGCMYFIIN